MEGVKWGEQEMWGASARGHGSFTPPWPLSSLKMHDGERKRKGSRSGGLLRAGMALNSPPFSSGTFIISTSRPLVNHPVCLDLVGRWGGFLEEVNKRRNQTLERLLSAAQSTRGSLPDTKFSNNYSEKFQTQARSCWSVPNVTLTSSFKSGSINGRLRSSLCSMESAVGGGRVWICVHGLKRRPVCMLKKTFWKKEKGVRSPILW